MKNLCTGCGNCWDRAPVITLKAGEHMDISQLWSAMAESGYFDGTSFRIVSISSGEERIVLPVTPWKYQVQLAQNNKIVEILDFGEMLAFGRTKLHRLKFSCFLPSLDHNYPFVVGDNRAPQEFLEILNRWKTAESPVRVIITDSPVNENFAIMNLDFNEKDGTRDIYYDLDFVEYRDWNVPESDYTRTVNSLTGLKDRPGVRSTDGITSFIETNARDLIEISKALGGSSGSTASTIGAIGKLTGNQAISDVANVWSAVSTGGWAALANPSIIGSTLRVATNPVGTVTTVIKSIPSVVKSAVKTVGNLITSPFRGIASIFGW